MHQTETPPEGTGWFKPPTERGLRARYRATAFALGGLSVLCFIPLISNLYDIYTRWYSGDYSAFTVISLSVLGAAGFYAAYRLGHQEVQQET